MAGKKNGKHARCILRSSCRFFLVHDRNVRNLLSVVVAVPAHLLFVHFYRILSNLMRMYYNSYLKRIAWGYKFTSEDIFELALLLQRTMIQSFIDENRYDTYWFGQVINYFEDQYDRIYEKMHRSSIMPIMPLILLSTGALVIVIAL